MALRAVERVEENDDAVCALLAAVLDDVAVLVGDRLGVVHDGHGQQPHTVQTTTPTGHTCTARAPDPP